MIVKLFEVRDRMTFVPVLAAKMVPLDGWEAGLEDVYEIYARHSYLLRRCGYPTEPPCAVLLTRLDGSGNATADPFAWGDRTFTAAHGWIADKFDELPDGAVVDVEFILGESPAPKRSEREL